MVSWRASWRRKNTHSRQGSKIQILSRVQCVIGLCEPTVVKWLGIDMLANWRMHSQITFQKNTTLAGPSGHIHSTVIPIRNPYFKVALC